MAKRPARPRGRVWFGRTDDGTACAVFRPSATHEGNWCGKPLLERSVDRLTHGDARECQMAVQRIRGFAASGKGAVPALIRAVDDPDNVVRLLAVVALGEIGPAASAAFHFWQKNLTMSDIVGPCVDAYVLTPDPAPVATGLRANWGSIGLAAIESASRRNAQARCRAATGLAVMKPPPMTAVPALVNALHDKESWVRSESARALGRIGPRVGKRFLCLRPHWTTTISFPLMAASSSLR